MKIQYYVLCFNCAYLRIKIEIGEKCENKGEYMRKVRHSMDALEKFGSVTSMYLTDTRQDYINLFGDKVAAASRWDTMPEKTWVYVHKGGKDSLRTE